MSELSIARNYAEVLFTLGEKSGQTQRYGDLVEAVAAAIANTPAIQATLMSPRIPKLAKAKLVAAAVKDAPAEFGLFLAAVVKRGRQAALGAIAHEYQALLDVKLNRVRAAVTLARQPDAALMAAVQAGLTQALGKEVIATFHADPAILGGAVVRVGDRVHDGSVRRNLGRLRRQLLSR